MLQLFNDFEGALPLKNIRRLDVCAFEARAYSECESESFRFDLGFINTVDRPEILTLNIQWPTVPFSELRDCFYLLHENDDDWKSVPAATGPGTSRLTVELPPGKTLLCLHPHYGVDDLHRFLAGLPENSVETFGKSEHGRDLPLVRFGNPDGRRFLFTARNHANETSGSYCMEGMISHLISDDPLMRYVLDKLSFTFVPMTNPDGVAEGMARFTAPRGADLHRIPEWNHRNRPKFEGDAALDACMELYQRLRPDYFINLHSYLFKFKDEIFAPSDEVMDRFIRFMPDQTEFGKTWYRALSDEKTFPTGYCAEKFGTVPLILEIPWFMRNAASMRETGRRILRAAILSMSLQGDSPWGVL